MSTTPTDRTPDSDVAPWWEAEVPDLVPTRIGNQPAPITAPSVAPVAAALTAPQAVPVAAPQAVPVVAPAAAPQAVPVTAPQAAPPGDDPTISLPRTPTPGDHGSDDRLPTPDPAPSATGGLTNRGAFLTLLAPTAVGMLVGFAVHGRHAIPATAGWGLLLGALLAAALIRPRLGWFPVALPPLAMLTAIAVLGQITLIGARPTPARELAMMAAGLTATAPAQLISVLIVAGAIWLRRRARR